MKWLSRIARKRSQKADVRAQGLSRAVVHNSLVATLGLFAIGLLVLIALNPSLSNLRSLAITLPVVWIISLTVRLAAQQLAVGAYSLELETRVGPTGNLSTDYEYMPSQQIFRYAVAGHAATAFLFLLGLAVSVVLLSQEAAISSAQTWKQNLAALVDIQHGWSSLAWASQILWVNFVIGCLNFLPTIPFDNRALLYSLLTRKRFGLEATVLHRLSLLNSHLSTALLGCGAAMLVVVVTSKNYEANNIWYAVVAASVYLFVASRWERSRALQLEEQYMPLSKVRRDSRHHQPAAPHGVCSTDSSQRQHRHSHRHTSSSSGRHHGQSAVGDDVLDDILRKLHREGTAALSSREKEALLMASHRLQEKRRSQQT
jgi:hypothetical protein